MSAEGLRVGAACAFMAALAGCSSPSSPSASSASSRTAADTLGATLYDRNCVACHQHDARGVPGVYPSLQGSALVLKDPRAFALWVVEGERPASMPRGRYATAMPKFGWMKDSDVAALLTYLRSNFGNAAPAVDAAAVANALGD